MINSSYIQSRVAALLERFGISKTKFGKAIGGKTDENYKVSILRASRFLNGNSVITVKQVNLICDFFDKPLEYFLSDNSENYIQSGSGIQNNIRENKDSRIINISGDNNSPDFIKKLSKLEPDQAEAIEALIDKFSKN